MKTKDVLIALIGAGLALECLAAPFVFPENNNEGRALTNLDYDDYEARLHHHNGHGQHGHHGGHHGGFNKRKKFKKKKKKKPCHYKTSDGRTFLWTGLNIYETNIYVNQGQGHYGDIGTGGTKPCTSGDFASSNESGESDDTLQSPQGAFQSPQRPNRPFLNNLASYIPSGPQTWNWLQGVHWNNYVPDQNSIYSAVNTIVNALPGFGPNRPRPPSSGSIPVRPITESPFTRPTDFTRPPTFTRPTQAPFTRPTLQPVFTRPTTTRPVFSTRPTQSPVFTRPTQQPIFTRPSTPSPQTSTEENTDENYDYSNFSSENTDSSSDTGINGLGSTGNRPSNNPSSNIPTVGSIGNGIKPVYERPSKYFNDYIVKPFRGSITQLVRWF